MSIPEYKTGPIRPGKAISEQSFKDTRENCVLATTDVLVVNDNSQVYLGHRTAHPKDMWWIFGGRMLAGEELKQSASRALHRELGLERIDPKNLFQVGFYSLYWNDNGQVDHALLAGFAYTVPSTVKLPVPADHDNARWFSFDEVLHGDFHPSLKQIIKDYHALMALQPKSLLQTNKKFLARDKT